MGIASERLRQENRMRFRRFLILLMTLTVAAAASAQGTRPEPTPTASTSQFVMGTRLGYITCSDKYRAYLERWELYALVNEGQRDPRGTPPSDSEVADCVHQTALRGNALYKDALRHVTTPKARAAYSEYMVAWDMALKGIRRAERETVQQYKARQRQVEDKLNALQAKLEATTPAA
jgi:hypothetical protein